MPIDSRDESMVADGGEAHALFEPGKLRSRQQRTVVGIDDAKIARLRQTGEAAPRECEELDRATEMGFPSRF